MPTERVGGALLAALGLIIYLVIVSPAFRKAVLVLALLVTAAIYLVKQGEKETREREQQLAAQDLGAVTAIRPEQIAVTDMDLAKEQYGDWWTLRGTVANNSASDLGSIDVA